MELAYGRRPPDVTNLETRNAEQLTLQADREDLSHVLIQRYALQAHLQARQCDDLRRDVAQRVISSDGPFSQGEKIFYWLTESMGPNKRTGTWIWVRLFTISDLRLLLKVLNTQ